MSVESNWETIIIEEMPALSNFNWLPDYFWGDFIWVVCIQKYLPIYLENWDLISKTLGKSLQKIVVMINKGEGPLRVTQGRRPGIGWRTT